MKINKLGIAAATALGRHTIARASLIFPTMAPAK
jgi:hypothetical protein